MGKTTKEKELMTFRLEQDIANYLHAKASQTNLYLTDILRTLINIGIRETKEVDKQLKEKQNVSIELQKFREHEDAIKLEIKKAYILKNAKSTIKQLVDIDIHKSRRNAVIKQLMARIKDVCGADSYEYKRVIKWSKQLQN